MAFAILKSSWIQINWDDLLLSFLLVTFFLLFFLIFGSPWRQAHAFKNRSFRDGWSAGGAWAMHKGACIKPQCFLTLLFNYVNLKNDWCIVTRITALLHEHGHLNIWLKGLRTLLYVSRKSHLNTGDSCFIYGRRKSVFWPFLSASCVSVI